MVNEQFCKLCGKVLIGKTYKCDVCGKLFCEKCQSFLSIAHVGSMNVGKACPECVNTNKSIMVIDPNNPRYFCKK